jgi:hypothetical protein
MFTIQNYKLSKPDSNLTDSNKSTNAKSLIDNNSIENLSTYSLTDNFHTVKSSIIPEIDLTVLEPIQLVSLAILLITLVLISSLLSICIYLLNGYFIKEYNLDQKYPKIIKYVFIYRTVSYYGFKFNLFLLVFCLMFLLFNGITFLFLV